MVVWLQNPDPRADQMHSRTTAVYIWSGVHGILVGSARQEYYSEIVEPSVTVL